jgi:hypothetical protein
VLGFPRLRVGLGCIKINDVKDVDDASTFLCSRFVRMRKWVPAFSRMRLRICSLYRRHNCRRFCGSFLFHLVVEVI